MSVYRPPKSPNYHYDFVVGGRRYHGSTGARTKSDAKTFEYKLRSKIASGTLWDASELTLSSAAHRWFSEKAAGSRSEKDVRRRIKTLLECAGADQTLSEIDAAVVAASISHRRTINPKISGATINRDIIAPLRAILYRARKVWGARNLPEIDWRELIQPESPGVTREYTLEEKRRWLAECRSEIERTALGLLLRYGMRFGELWFHPTDVDAIGARLTLRRRKRNEWSTLVLPLQPEDARNLGRLAAIALSAARNDVWGLRYFQMHYGLRTAAAKAGVMPGRVINGTRHHAATTITRSSGNLLLAKKLLGHASIMSTMRYAHASEDDLRQALRDDKSRNSPVLIRRRVRKTHGGQGKT